ncbi:MAG: hypothetical protein ACOC5R_04915, partial [Elusimicrobiota bacterium]
YELIKFPIDSVERLDKSPGRKNKDYWTVKEFFTRYLRMQLTLAFLYPQLHFHRLPRNMFDFWYHKYLCWRGRL